MKTKTLIAKPKPGTTMRYGTRRLQAGEIFEASERDANLLTRIGRAEYALGGRAPAKIPAMPAALKAHVMRATSGAATADTAPAEPDERQALRAEYEAATGRRPYWGWDAGMLRAKIADAGAAASNVDEAGAAE